MSAKKKIVCLCMSILMVFSVSGCQLAKTEEEQNKESEQAQLIGVYITDYDETDYDMSGNAKVDKVYAKCVEVEQDGIKSHEYIFEDYDGMSYFQAYVPAKISGTNGYYTTMCSEGIINGNIKLVAIDSGDNTTMEADVYFIENAYVCVNEVYQEVDGDIYFVPAQMSNYISGGITTISIIEEGASLNTSIKINLSVKGEPTEIKVTQIGEDKILKSQAYKSGDMPEKLQVKEGTEYIIVKTDYADDEDSQIEIYTSEDIVMRTISEVRNNKLTYENTELIWQK